MRSLVWGLSWLRCSWHILPSSLNASLMSRTLRRSRALLATRRSRSRSIFTSGGTSSSSSSGLVTNEEEMIKVRAGLNVQTSITQATWWLAFSVFKLSVNSTNCTPTVELCTEQVHKNKTGEMLNRYNVNVHTRKPIKKLHLLCCCWGLHLSGQLKIDDLFCCVVSSSTVSFRECV